MLITLAVIVLDQITKLWTLNASGDIPGTIMNEVIPGYFNFVDYRNTGAAWGMFSNNPLPLSMISLLAFFYFILDFPSLTENIKFRKFTWAMLIGGVFGNFIDRFFRREVIDMIEVFIPLPGNNYRFPAFNIADAAICVGVFLYFFHVLFFSKKESAVADKEQETV
ncbi:MAG: signal peptidase II [Lentisphaeraceae bacterium]|nr:signal peptidase II [Lentisphaeraceae bacterium]